MILFRQQSRASDLCRCLLAAIAGLAYLLASIGFPLPTIRAEEKRLTASVRACGCPVEGAGQGCCCCSASASGCCGGQSESPSIDPEQSEVDWVIGEKQQSCQGLTTAWAFTVSALPPTEAETFVIDQTVCELVVLNDEQAERVRHQPQPPPPRALSSGTDSRAPVSTGEKSAF
jgi:hypothetical protein